MAYRRWAHSGLQVSVLGLGTNHFGPPLAYPAAEHIVRQAVEAGINVSEPSNPSGDGQADVCRGRALRGHRPQVLVPTGTGPHARTSWSRSTAVCSHSRRRTSPSPRSTTTPPAPPGGNATHPGPSGATRQGPRHGLCQVGRLAGGGSQGHGQGLGDRGAGQRGARVQDAPRRHGASAPAVWRPRPGGESPRRPAGQRVSARHIPAGPAPGSPPRRHTPPPSSRRSIARWGTRGRLSPPRGHARWWPWPSPGDWPIPR
jgi:hypothetical protein